MRKITRFVLLFACARVAAAQDGASPAPSPSPGGLSAHVSPIGVKPGAPPPPAVRPKVWLEGIPDSNQARGYTCGVAVFEAVATRFRMEIAQDTLEDQLGATPDLGTHPRRMIEGFLELGLEAELVEGMTVEALRAHLDRKDVVIVDFQAWGVPAFKDYTQAWEDGHYGIAVGYDDTYLYIEDPAVLGSVGYVAWADFEKRWHDYEMEDGKRREYHHLGLVVRGPGEPPPELIPIE